MRRSSLQGHQWSRADRVAMAECSIVFDHPFLRSEFDWLAVDVSGFLGYFSTAGAGPVPTPALRIAESLETVQEQVLELPVRGGVSESYNVAPCIDDWIEVARRGLYAFDWRREEKKYQLIARPSVPILAYEVPEESAAVSFAASKVSLLFNFSVARSVYPIQKGTAWVLAL